MAREHGDATDVPPAHAFVRVPDDGAPVAPVLGPTTTPWVLDLIRRFRAAGPSLRICPHLVADADEGAVWQAAVPDLRSCRREACTAAVRATLEARSGGRTATGSTRCTTCGRVGVAVRGVGVAVGPTMLRGTVCEDCLAATPVPTPPAATAPLPTVPGGEGSVLGSDEEPLDGGTQEPGAATGGDAADPVRRLEETGRRALRRGWLLADACCRTTTARTGEDGLVALGLLVRAAKLARGLAGPAAPDAAFARDLGFRELVMTTTTLWWLLHAEPGASADVAAALRGPDASGLRPGDVRARLGALGREDDHVLLLGPAGDAPSGTWAEVATLHLSATTDGTRAALGQPCPDPRRALVAGEHLSLACADYAERLRPELDPAEVRRLADEVVRLRRDVERAADGAPAGSEVP